MTIEREKIIQLFNEADRLFGWKPGHGNETVLGYLEAFRDVAIADFLKTSGQYITNDATRDACIKSAQADSFEQAAKLCETMEIPFDLGVWIDSTKREVSAQTAIKLGEAIRQLGKLKP